MEFQRVCEPRSASATETGNELRVYRFCVDSLIAFGELITRLDSFKLAPVDAVFVARPFVPYSRVPMLKTVLGVVGMGRSWSVQTRDESLDFFRIY